MYRGNAGRRERAPLRHLLLRSLAAAGIVSVALLAPKMLKLLKQFDRPAQNRTQLYKRIAQGVDRLERSGFVAISGEWGKRRVKITDKGVEALEKLEFGEYSLSAPMFWDGKWRVLMFDITERRRRVRDQLRRLLQGAGFVRIQDSVWVYPYPCDEFVSLIRAHLKSGVGEVRYFVAEALEADHALREHFYLRT